MRHGSYIRKAATIAGLVAAGATCALGVSSAQNGGAPGTAAFARPNFPRFSPIRRGIVPPELNPPSFSFGQPVNGGTGNGDITLLQLRAQTPMLPGQVAPPVGSALPVTPGFSAPGFPVPFANTLLPGFGNSLGAVPNAGMTLGPLQAAQLRNNLLVPGAITTAPMGYTTATVTSPQGAMQRGAAPAQTPMASRPAPATGTGAVRTSNSRRTRVRGAMDVATAQRFNMARSQGALRSAEVVRANAATVWVKVDENGMTAVRQVPASSVFFYRGGELLDGAIFPSMAQPGETVMIIDSSRRPL